MQHIANQAAFVIVVIGFMVVVSRLLILQFRVDEERGRPAGRRLMRPVMMHRAYDDVDSEEQDQRADGQQGTVLQGFHLGIIL
jgi:hypothetical protein